MLLAHLKLKDKDEASLSGHLSRVHNKISPIIIESQFPCISPSHCRIAVV